MKLPDDLISVPEAAKILRCSEPAVWNWVRNRRLASYKLAGRRFISRAHLAQLFTFTPAEQRLDRRRKSVEAAE